MNTKSDMISSFSYIATTLDNKNQMKYLSMNIQSINLTVQNKSDKLSSHYLVFQNSKLDKKNDFSNQLLRQLIVNATRYRKPGNISPDRFSNRPIYSLTRAKTTATSVMNLSTTGVNETRCKGLDDGMFIRDPNDCASFYTCLMGKTLQRSTCDNGLVFDPKIKVCNWKNMVKC